MSLIIRRTCHGITAIGGALFLIGLLADHPVANLGVALLIVFGLLSGLLHVKRLF